MKKLLITAFVPFGKQTHNSSLEVVRKLRKQFKGIELVFVKLPVVFNIDLYGDLLKQHQPDYLLMCGQAGGRKLIECEKVAINYVYSRQPDNIGVIIKGSRIIYDGPDAYFSTAPLLPIVNKLQEEKLPVQMSFSAGTYVCNFSYYLMLHTIHIHHLCCEAMFVHFPYFAGQTADNFPSLGLKEMVNTLKRLIE
ncbi:MAG TPA: pyroglutamyl-peptidase I, partial [Bacilli bacterium]|nr:pyroglutamyl-peptidase I [Bacilli bacterium]